MADTHKYHQFLELSTINGLVTRKDAEDACQMAWAESQTSMLSHIVEYSPDIQEQFHELERLVESHAAWVGKRA